MKRNSLPGAESEPVMRRNSLTAQFIRLLVGSGCWWGPGWDASCCSCSCRRR